ncbi:cytochrome c [Ferriphaselus sp. R-1]|uniref:c-type cytochrome n=1 Tax=Ferriphaselus sp. R-1 TaxID=1485544 RepID=UPI000554F455|nr:cytochrome c [Ferriphaselus sp. R-1]
MKKLTLTIALALAPTLAQAFPWDHDMANQISIKPQESVDGKAGGMKPFPKRSVPVAGTSSFVKDQGAAEKMANPVPADEKSVAEGKRLFAIYCSACHGAGGKGDGKVGEKLVLQPFDLTADQTRSRTDGFIWGYMTFGGAIMPAYANDLNATERWHVVNYVRKTLQGGAATAAAK